MTTGVKAVAAVGTFALIGAHLTIGDFGFLLIGVAYLISIVRDWRPVRQLREENRELRAERDDDRKKLEAQEQRIKTLEESRDVARALVPLERALDQARSDMSHEHEKIILHLDALSKGVETGITELVKGLSGNTAVTATLAAGINAETVGPHKPQ